jgi:hypothetical protein
MTVCIAAIAAESKAVVCIADRALTYAGYAANSESDSAIAKIVDLPGNWCAMFSCDSLTFPKRVLDSVVAQLLGEARVTLAQMEAAVKLAYETCWWNEIEDHVLKPILLTKNDFVARKSDLLPLDSQLVLKLAKEMSEYKQVCSMIFCGFDGDMPHLFVANTPVDIDPADWEGFAAVGSGLETARNQMLWSRYSKDDSLPSVLYDVFNAKVATEVLQTIGYAWNWRIIVPGKKPEPLPKEVDKFIDKLWAEYSQSPFSEKSRTSQATIEAWRKKVRSFAVTVLAKARIPKSTQ